MNKISIKIDNVLPLPKIDKQLFLSKLERVELTKNHLVMVAGKIEHYIYFIEMGIARAFYEDQKQQTTIWFGEEGDIIISYLSSFKNLPGYESIELLEDCVLYRISNNALKELYQSNINIANWGRKFAEQELLKTEQRFMDLQFKTATERYHQLLSQSPTILMRVKLRHIASYLGITQVSLSRIRAVTR